jgi:predicted HTH transcriptional regulator
MNFEKLSKLLKKIVSTPKENEWIEFKTNNTNPEEIGKWISALSNTALLENQEFGYLVFGVSDEREIIGTRQFSWIV